jgi:two-component system, NtrC family, response regulator AtoC
MSTQFRILIADDEPAAAEHVRTLLNTGEYSVQAVNSGRECLSALRQSASPFDLVLLDTEMPEMNGMETLRQARRLQPQVPMVMLHRSLSPKFMLEATQAGAQSFLAKPVRAEDLKELTEAVSKVPAAEPADHAGFHMEDLGSGHFFLAASPAMLAILKQVRMLSHTDVPVLITGESGVGKEIVATLLHRHSLRASRTFMKVNCAALPADLLESELFGYEAGAFTGAMKSKPGKFEICDRGTILLDEIGEMSPQLQAKLLHVLQDGSFSRLGGRINSKADVRVIAATNVDIEQAIIDKRFREDLYYRLNAFTIRIPALRERSQEIPYLLHELAGKLALAHNLEPIDFSPRLISAAVQYQWPGNLRELGNFIKRYLIIRDEMAALVELESKLMHRAVSLPVAAGVATPVADPGLKSLVRSTKDQTEIRLIREVLDQAHWNRRIAAERLQISYKSLLQKIRLYNLDASA